MLSRVRSQTRGLRRRQEEYTSSINPDPVIHTEDWDIELIEEHDGIDTVSIEVTKGLYQQVVRPPIEEVT